MLSDLNHPNAHFMYHYGNAGNYGGYPYGNPKPTHWHPNMEINIGTPVTRTGADYWGGTNTDRFYEFASGSDYRILAREYSNALVLANFGSGGWDNIGNNLTTHQLDGGYYPLLDDNTNGPAVTSITLGQSEGAILLKEPVETLNMEAEEEAMEEEEVEGNGTVAYPNPVEDTITVDHGAQPFKSWTVYDMAGKKVGSGSFIDGDQIDVSHLSQGVYLLQLMNLDEKIVMKFIKK